MSEPLIGERYVRNLDIRGWDHCRLRAASVIVAGVGGLGTEVARLLAQAGVGCSPADRSVPAWHLACGRPEEMGASAPVTARARPHRLFWLKPLEKEPHGHRS